ncbi:unnamed protein product, partial [Sphenostylis stenocarpa]
KLKLGNPGGRDCRVKLQGRGVSRREWTREEGLCERVDQRRGLCVTTDGAYGGFRGEGYLWWFRPELVGLRHSVDCRNRLTSSLRHQLLQRNLAVGRLVDFFDW